MAITSGTSISPAISLIADHRVFRQDRDVMMDDPSINLTDMTLDTGPAAWSNYGNRSVLRMESATEPTLNGDYILYGGRFRNLSSGTDLDTPDGVQIETFDEVTYMEIGGWSINPSVQFWGSGGQNHDGRANIVGFVEAGSRPHTRIEFRAKAEPDGTNDGSQDNLPVVGIRNTVVGDQREAVGAVDVDAVCPHGSFSGERFGLVVDYKAEDQGDDGIVRVYMADLSALGGLAALREITPELIRLNSIAGFNVPVVETTTWNGGPVGGVRIDGGTRRLGLGSDFKRQVEARGFFDSTRTPKLDLDSGLGSMIYYDEVSATEYAVAVFSQCPPGTFDATATESWMRLQQSADGSTWTDIAGTDRQLVETDYHWADAVRTPTLTKASAVHIRAQFYDGDPATTGTLMGSGPALTPTHGPKVASVYCTGHGGDWRPQTDYLHAADRAGVGMIYCSDDFGYPTGQASGGPCTAISDFTEVYLHLFLDPDIAVATRTVPINVAFGDHNWGLDAIDNSDWSETVDTITRWDGTTTETRKQVAENARAVIHRWFQRVAPNRQAFNADPALSGYDWWCRFGGGHRLYHMETVARRNLVADSLASNAATNYPGTTLDQEAAFGAAMAGLPPKKYGLLGTVRVNGPGELTFVDNWFEQTNHPIGFNRLVQQFKDNAPASSRMAAVTGDRHLCECNKAFPGTLADGTPASDVCIAEITTGPGNVRHWGEAPSDFDNGANTLLSYTNPTIANATFKALVARVHGIVSFAPALDVEVYERQDDGTSTLVASGLGLPSLASGLRQRERSGARARIFP